MLSILFNIYLRSNRAKVSPYSQFSKGPLVHNGRQLIYPSKIPIENPLQNFCFHRPLRVRQCKCKCKQQWNRFHGYFHLFIYSATEFCSHCWCFSPFFWLSNIRLLFIWLLLLSFARYNYPHSYYIRKMYLPNRLNSQFNNKFAYTWKIRWLSCALRLFSSQFHFPLRLNPFSAPQEEFPWSKIEHYWFSMGHGIVSFLILFFIFKCIWVVNQASYPTLQIQSPKYRPVTATTRKKTFFLVDSYAIIWCIVLAFFRRFDFWLVMIPTINIVPWRLILISRCTINSTIGA